MKSSESKEYLAFDYHTIRLIIGLIAVLFPVVVSVRASKITDSISWSYHTDARDYFVGFLFVICAFLISYKGHKHTLDKNDVGKFWSWVNNFWKGAINFRIWERKHEEDLVSWMGGVAAGITAVCPTAHCLGKECPYDPISYIHYMGANVLFSTTVYFCLVAFKSQAIKKIKRDEKLPGKSGFDPKKLRVGFYSFCGWGIVVIMVGLVVLKSTELHTISNTTFWAETFALELFGVAWLIASQYLPVVTSKTERQKLF
jgi:hypothetical protein